MNAIERLLPVALLVLLIAEHFIYGGAWITVAALAIFAIYLAFKPRKGMIGLVKLPQDDGFLSEEAIQWWYWTGHLETEDGRRFGFEVVFFAFRNFGLFWDQLV